MKALTDRTHPENRKGVLGYCGSNQKTPISFPIAVGGATAEFGGGPIGIGHGILDR